MRTSQRINRCIPKIAGRVFVIYRVKYFKENTTHVCNL